MTGTSGTMWYTRGICTFWPSEGLSVSTWRKGRVAGSCLTFLKLTSFLLGKEVTFFPGASNLWSWIHSAGTGYPWVYYTCSLFLLVDELLERCLVFGTVQSCMHVLFCKPQVKQLRTENVVATEGTLRTAHAT